MNVEQLLKNAPLETLLAVFFNTEISDSGNYFYVISTYKQATSKYATNIFMPDNSHDDTAKKLTKKYHLDFYKKSNVTICAQIANNLHLSQDDFLNKVYEAILPKITITTLNLDTEMASALFVLRGSADFTMGYYAVDIKKPTQRYIDNFFKLLLSTDDLMSRLNLNFRELQPQFVSGEAMRNTQVRINLKWYYDNVASKEDLNSYKNSLMSRNLQNLGETRQYNGFEDRLITYRESILGRKLSSYEISAIRSDLEFTRKEITSEPENKFGIRNQKIVAYAREIFDDVCVGCGHKYHIEDRSFKMPRNNRYYFEVNHVIAYANDSSAVDVLDNLVKLCPTCHRALTPGRAFPELQKDIITRELDSRPEVRRFVLSMMPTGKYQSPEEFVLKTLK